MKKPAQTLKQIAAMPLWGEPIKNADLRKEYAESGEYDLAGDEFNPSCDTESTMLRDAVEMAREALGQPVVPKRTKKKMAAIPKCKNALTSLRAGLGMA